MYIPNAKICRYHHIPSRPQQKNEPSKEAVARSAAEKAHSAQDRLMQLYGLSGQEYSKANADKLRSLGFKGDITEKNWETVVRGQIEAQGQKVNTAFQSLTAIQNILKNIHEMIMASVRNMRLQ